MLPITPYGFLRAAAGLEPTISNYKLDVLPLEHSCLFYKPRQGVDSRDDIMMLDVVPLRAFGAILVFKEQ